MSSNDAGPDREPAFNVIIVPEGGGKSRTYRLSRGRVRAILATGIASTVVLAALVGSWWYLALRSARLPGLEVRVAELEAERDEIAALATDLEELEERYARIRDMFGSGTADASGLWLPPPGAGRARARDGDTDSIPSAWPLADRGFVTRSLLEGESGDHPGVDIAVPVDTYVRAAGAGTVSQVEQDPVYGIFVAVEHARGYRTLYAHASIALVEVGQSVRRGEVIALSGNTGRSTAPHLHFEVSRAGRPVDPLAIVRPPV